MDWTRCHDDPGNDNAGLSLASPDYSRANVAAVHQEVHDRQTLLDELAKAVDSERRRWTSANPEIYFVVADTSV